MERQTTVCWENKEHSYSASHAGCWKNDTEINEEVPWNITQKDRPHGAALGDQKQPALSEQPCIEGGRWVVCASTSPLARHW